MYNLANQVLYASFIFRIGWIININLLCLLSFESNKLFYFNKGFFFLEIEIEILLFYILMTI